MYAEVLGWFWPRLLAYLTLGHPPRRCAAANKCGAVGVARRLQCVVGSSQQRNTCVFMPIPAFRERAQRVMSTISLSYGHLQVLCARKSETWRKQSARR